MKSKLFEKTWFRMLPVILGGVLLILIAAGVAVAVRWHMSAKEAADPVLLGEPVYEIESKEPMIGMRFNAVLKYRLPCTICRIRDSLPVILVSGSTHMAPSGIH